MKRKKLSKVITAISVLVVALIPAITYVQAAGFHLYEIATFKDNVAELRCVLCEEHITVDFMDCFNLKKNDTGYNSAFDVVKDNYVNAKDYAKINKTEYTTKPTTQPTTSHTTTEKSTDKDGWDNEIIKP